MGWLNNWENERDDLRDELANYQHSVIDPIKTLSNDAIFKIIRANLSPTFHAYIDELTYRFE